MVSCLFPEPLAKSQAIVLLTQTLLLSFAESFFFFLQILFCLFS